MTATAPPFPVDKGPTVRLWKQILQYSDLLQENECWKVNNMPSPDLDNQIHPMFRMGRWVGGQGSIGFYPNMVPALRLVSLMLTEPLALCWFHHVANGRIETHAGPEENYIKSTRMEHESAGHARTRFFIDNLSECITLMFIPPDSKEKQASYWGVTYLHRREVPWATRIPSYSWPKVILRSSSEPRFQKSSRPSITIALNTNFAQFFAHGFSKVSLEEKYRAWFMFVATLMHEVAHAFHFYLRNDEAEPRWAKHEAMAELGYSLESVIFGKIISPFVPWPSASWNQPLVSVHMRDVDLSSRSDHDADRHEFLRTHLDDHEWASMDFIRVSVEHLKDGMFDRQPWRGQGWENYTPKILSKNRDMTIMHGIPMHWISAWFSKDHWVDMRQNFWIGGSKIYRPPSLGPTFLSVYERDILRGKARLFYGTKKKEDPFLESVIKATTDMHLYDDKYWK
jgi:hypothetical protein